MTAPLQRSKKKLWAQPPRTAMEVYNLLPETAHAEVINNTLYMPPAPSFEHQETSGEMFFSIKSFVKRSNSGKCVYAPVSVFLNEDTVVEPDLVYISNEKLGMVQNGKIRCVPDIIIELLSSSNRNHDLQTKFEIYERFGLPEYFIVDPSTKEVVHYVLQDKKYQLQPATKGRLDSKMLVTSFSF